MGSKHSKKKSKETVPSVHEGTRSNYSTSNIKIKDKKKTKSSYVSSNNDIGFYDFGGCYDSGGGCCDSGGGGCD